MENVDEIKRRMSSEKNVKEHHIIKFFNVIFVFCIIALGGLIYCKSDENGTLIKKIFHQDVNFKEFNNTIDEYIGKLFFIEKGENDPVSQTPVTSVDLYQSLGNNCYTSVDKTIRAINNGKVLSSSYQEEYQYFIVVEYDNEVKALYTLVSEIKVKINDVITPNQVIGDYQGDYFQCVFTYKDEVIDYQQALR